LAEDEAMPVIYKDGVPENTHPLNVVEVPDDFVAAVDQVTRPPLYEVYMRMAEELAKRSTCARLQVGTVIKAFRTGAIPTRRENAGASIRR
jgi:deoxycytidylate deaminase